MPRVDIALNGTEAVETAVRFMRRATGRPIVIGFMGGYHGETLGVEVLEVVEHVCGGSPEELVTALLDYRGLSPQELKRIRSMLDEAKATRPPHRGDS
jgi:4-aminobutyrate aminotransferase-like enzyme